MNDLLPPSATDQERALAAVTERIENLPVDIRKLWNTQTCPVALLPVLAWTLSVDEWSDDWTEAQKRSVCTASAHIHAIKGSRRSVEQAVESIGAGISLKEWWEQSPEEEPHTFTVTVAGGSTVGNSITYQQQLHRLINNAKPLRSHYTLNIGAEFSSTLYLKPELKVAVISRGTFE